MTPPDPLAPRKTPVRSQPRVIALIAHDNKKQDLVEWGRFNLATLRRHHLVATGTTGGILERDLGLKVEKLKSGPMGGDQQIGARIVEGGVDLVIFFWDPMSPHPHDVDVKALLRIAVLYNIPMACNRSTADFVISSTILSKPYEPVVKDFGSYIDRSMP